MTSPRPHASRWLVAGLVLIAGLVFEGNIVSAHPLAPSLLRLDVRDDGTVEVLWRTPTGRPIGEELTPLLPTQCRPITEPRIEHSARQDAVEHRWRVDCGDAGLVGASVSVRGLSTASTNVVVEVTADDGSSARGLLHRGRDVFVVPQAQGSSAIIADYVRLGVEHLLTGPDHVLFVLGLLILIRSWRRLVSAITSFTVGHSVSLALAALGVVRFPQGPIEVAIALSLIVLALDIVRAHKEMSPGPMMRWPWVVCAVFGLIHGLGFAGALAHTGLPEHAIPLSLFAFNGGVELGQLMIVALGVLAWRLLRRWYASRDERFKLAPAYMIGSLAAFWVLERTLGGLGLM